MEKPIYKDYVCKFARSSQDGIVCFGMKDWEDCPGRYAFIYNPKTCPLKPNGHFPKIITYNIGNDNYKIKCSVDEDEHRDYSILVKRSSGAWRDLKVNRKVIRMKSLDEIKEYLDKYLNNKEEQNERGVDIMTKSKSKMAEPPTPPPSRNIKGVGKQEKKYKNYRIRKRFDEYGWQEYQILKRWLVFWIPVIDWNNMQILTKSTCEAIKIELDKIVEYGEDTLYSKPKPTKWEDVEIK